MTVAEVERYINGAMWRMKLKAQFDYKLSDLVAISVSRILSDSKLPSIGQVYPELFEEEAIEEKKEEDNVNKSVNNFLNMALQINANIKKKRGEENK